MNATERPISLLVIDDAEDDAALILRAMKAAGVAVKHTRVENEAALTEAMKAQTFDAVLCDFNLPSYDAFAALKRVRENLSDVPFIVVSGSVGEEIAVELIKRGANDFVPKQHLGRVPTAVTREISERLQRAERRRVEQALAESQERFRVLVQSMDDIVFSVGPSQRIERVYGRGLAALGISADQLTGRTLEELVGPERADAVRGPVRDALNGKSSNFEWVSPLGRNFSVTLSPLVSGEGVVGAVGIARDITAQKRAEAQAVLADRMASIGTLAAGVAHEINNPLASLHSNLAFVIGELKALEPELSSQTREKLKETFAALTDSVEASGRVRDIVRDLKLFSRDREDEQPGPVNLHDVIESSLRMARNEIRHRAQVMTDLKVVPPVMGTPSRLGQVVLNLLVNAAQAIPDGHAAENEIRVSASAEDDAVIVEVTDTGVGMTEETQKRIFTPFFTTKPVGVGTGLGLSICYRIVTDMGGRISVQSKPGDGTTIRLSLPVAKDSQPATIAEKGTSAQVTPERRVLVIDDEAMIGKAIERALGRHHKVETMTNARAALDRARQGGFDLILCDMMMPDMNGMEFHAALKETHPELANRVVFLTGGAFTDQSRRFLEEHGAQRLEKPFEIAQLLAIIERTARA